MGIYRCESCLWHDQCGSEEESCQYYSPTGDQEVDYIIENGRIDFYAEWFEAIEE